MRPSGMFSDNAPFSECAIVAALLVVNVTRSDELSAPYTTSLRSVAADASRFASTLSRSLTTVKAVGVCVASTTTEPRCCPPYREAVSGCSVTTPWSSRASACTFSSSSCLYTTAPARRCPVPVVRSSSRLVRSSRGPRSLAWRLCEQVLKLRHIHPVRRQLKLDVRRRDVADGDASLQGCASECDDHRIEHSRVRRKSDVSRSQPDWLRQPLRLQPGIA